MYKPSHTSSWKIHNFPFHQENLAVLHAVCPLPFIVGFTIVIVPYISVPASVDKNCLRKNNFDKIVVLLKLYNKIFVE